MSAVREEVPGDVYLRPLAPADLPAVMAIERASFSTPWRESTFRGLMLRRDSNLVAATREDRPVGYAVCWTVGDQAELGNVAVAPTERGRGTGRRLVDAILAIVRQRGARECFLEVRESNGQARALYEQCDFRLVGRRRNYYSQPTEDAFVMRRDLI
ncbi:MAG: ribosomal-protein-alanine N-acetyltransferase [Gemmatimonas sp.]|nr:ribosomal-protein-alanine N-acetyltransferase [Gemmatimonas sp.]